MSLRKLFAGVLAVSASVPAFAGFAAGMAFRGYQPEWHWGLESVTISSLDSGTSFAKYKGAFPGNAAPLQLSLIPVVPPAPPLQLYDSSTSIYGVSIGLAPVQKRVVGLQVGAIGYLTDTMTGLSVGLGNFSARNYGLAVGLFNQATDVAGVQVGAWNSSPSPDSTAVQIGAINIAERGWQLGLINYNRNSAFPVMILLNFSSSGDHGTD